LVLKETKYSRNSYIDQILDAQGTLRYLGVPIDVKAFILGDNQSVVTSATLPHSKYNK